MPDQPHSKPKRRHRAAVWSLIVLASRVAPDALKGRS